MKEIITTVIDAGGRYGLHPSWKPFKGGLGYYLFEPDAVEAKRLKEKYSSRSKEIFIYDQALGETNGTLEINFFHNRAMSSSCKRYKEEITFVGEKKDEVKIVDRKRVPMVTVDNFCLENRIDLDFLKLDTEGTELGILNGSVGQLNKNVLGVRSEVNFDYVFEGMPLFSALHEFMLKAGFFLLNISYKGQGAPMNEFVNVNEQYGIIRDPDAIWIRRKSGLFDATFKPGQQMDAKVLKYASFCLLNSASDVAVDVLLEARGKHHISFDRLRKSRLYVFLDIQLHKLFYSLKWQPGQSLKKHRDTYFAIFGKKMLELNEYNQSLVLNPD